MEEATCDQGSTPGGAGTLSTASVEDRTVRSKGMFAHFELDYRCGQLPGFPDLIIPYHQIHMYMPDYTFKVHTFCQHCVCINTTYAKSCSCCGAFRLAPLSPSL